MRVSRLTNGVALILLGTSSLTPAQAPKVLPTDNKCRLDTLERALKLQRQMPDLTGCPFEAVNAILHRFDYPPTRSDVSSTEPAGQIVNQSPPAGAPLIDPVRIDLQVSTGVVPTDQAMTADISVAINESESQKPYSAGQSVKYDIVISNAGPSVATNIRVDDTPTNLRITGVSGSCSSFPCQVVDLNPTYTALISVTAVIVSDGAFTNEAVATHAERDPNPANDSASSGGDASTSVDLSVRTRSQTSEPLHPGDKAVFVSEVYNAGPSTARDVRVISRLTNLTLTDVLAGCSASECVIPSIEPGKSSEIVIEATVNNDGTFEDTVAVSSDQTDLNPSNNSATVAGSATISVQTERSGTSGVALRPWMWVAGAAVLFTGLAGATHSVRKARWRSRMTVRASLDHAEVSPVPDSNAISRPQLSIRVGLDMGTAGPKGPVPIVKEAVERD